jgi:nucleotide-binding universal stress UspA family protein
MFDTIILALDGSPRSESAVEVVAELAPERAQVIAVQVKTQARETEQDALIEAQLERLRAAGVPVELERGSTAVGDEANVIARIARRRDGKLIVATTRGHSPLSGVLVGSVTQRLLHVAHCPVLVIPPADFAVEPAEAEAEAAEVAR